MMLAIPFPQIDPVALALGPLVIRWYALAYLGGFLFAWWYCSRLSLWRPGCRPNPDDLSDFLTWAVIGVILGGRLGNVLFYHPFYYLQNPLEAFMIWKGGMSFHGGFLGVVVATILFSRRLGFSPFALGDLLACAAPVGLFLGRLANFVNGELWGRPTDVPWAMIFPHSDGLPRHPSQLYQAGLEGIVLFLALFILARRPGMLDRTGTLSGCFLVGYGLARITGEFFREPDANIGFLAFGVTMGQLLSVPMVLIGLFLIARAPWGRRALAG
ncbi:prolipoprotein diacylglyceryl transferase [Oleisolibacter albus]|uniref:prolipoprotein diacylglyceryl transferase n=1 Tax=Oleisolibacter albus TaxID=2171757 RepID=UPI001875F351|nr:prolipoprotein diacylglyceryl transferase [Oleisolibacter albus]